MSQNNHRAPLRRGPSPLIILAILALLAALLAGRPGASAEGAASQGGWRFEIEEGKRLRSTVSINNRCSRPHNFRIRNKPAYLRFEQPTEAILIGPAATKQLGVVFDAAGLKSKLYRDKVIVECLDCKKEKACSQDRDEIPVEMRVVRPAAAAAGAASSAAGAGPTARVSLLFKWSGILRPGGGGGCDMPLGVCIIFGFRLAAGELSPAQIADGFGTADFRVEGDRLRMAFHREAALADGTVRIDRDKQLEPEVAAALGYERVVLKAGAYKVDKSRGQFGEALVEITKGNALQGARDNTGVAKVVSCQMYSQITGRCTGCGVACDDGTNYPMPCGADIFRGVNDCASKRIVYDPGHFGKAEVFKGNFTLSDPAVVRQRERGVAETFGADGAEVDCAAAAGRAAGAFMVVVPRLERPARN